MVKNYSVIILAGLFFNFSLKGSSFDQYQKDSLQSKSNDYQHKKTHEIDASIIDTIHTINQDTTINKEVFYTKDSILKGINNSLTDSIKDIIIISDPKFQVHESNKIIDSVNKDPYFNKLNSSIENNSLANTNNILWIFVTSIGLIFISIILFFIIKKFNSYRVKIRSLKNKNKELVNKVIYFENKELASKSNNKFISNQKIRPDNEIKKIKYSVTKKLFKQNLLNNSEIQKLTSKKENRWLTIGHSAIGKNHIQSKPPVPCQDSNHFESLNEKWQLAIVCDGAGSSKMSHKGSKFISQTGVPNILKKELADLKWYKNGSFPSKNEWKNFGIYILKETYKNLSAWIKQNDNLGAKGSIDQYASTVIIALYNSRGVLVLNIGDGRGGYLNKSGEFKGLFAPFKGDESNSTIFITSPIWKDPGSYIQTDVVIDEMISIFLLSDGMEKIAFECSNLTDNVFVDPNIPYKKFFLPILTKIKSVNYDEELKLNLEWEKFINSGNDAIKNEGDDKTLLISLLK